MIATLNKILRRSILVWPWNRQGAGALSESAQQAQLDKRRDMAHFYGMLLKMEKKRPGFNAKRVLVKTYPLERHHDLP